VTESGNAAVTQASNSGVGNLAAALTGAGTTAITIRSAIGQVFDTTADLVVAVQRFFKLIWYLLHR